jgi:hypothetical protein
MTAKRQRLARQGTWGLGAVRRALARLAWGDNDKIVRLAHVITPA